MCVRKGVGLCVGKRDRVGVGEGGEGGGREVTANRKRKSGYVARHVRNGPERPPGDQRRHGQGGGARRSKGQRAKVRGMSKRECANSNGGIQGVRAHPQRSTQSEEGMGGSSQPKSKQKQTNKNKLRKLTAVKHYESHK